MQGLLARIATLLGDAGAVGGLLEVIVADRAEVQQLVAVGAESWGFVHADGHVCEASCLKLGILQVWMKWKRTASPRELAQILPGRDLAMLWGPQPPPAATGEGEVIRA